MEIEEGFRLFVIEGKDKNNIENPNKFQTTAHVFHDNFQADEESKRLLEEGIFSEIRVREYFPDSKDEGFVILNDANCENQDVKDMEGEKQ